jgi:hypothetical protein
MFFGDMNIYLFKRLASAVVGRFPRSATAFNRFLCSANKLNCQRLTQFNFVTKFRT